jgi:ABC-2 type transport system permease protein
MTGLFPNAWHIARREYLTRVRGRAFVVTTGLLALVAVAVLLLPMGLTAIGVADPPAIAVHVDADDLAVDPVAELRASLTATGADEPGSEPEVTSIDDPDAAADRVRTGELDGLLTISRDPSGELIFSYLSGDELLGSTRQLVQQAADDIAVSDRLSRAGVELSADMVTSPAAFEAEAVDAGEGLTEEDFGPALLVAYALVIGTFMAILTYGNWVAQSVAEEKSSRVMELLITAATPRQLLAGKVLGTGAAGLTQYLAVLLAAAAAFVVSRPLGESLGIAAGQIPDLPSFTPGQILALAAFFLGGFLLYCTLYAATGSMVSRQEDVQQASGVLVVVAMVGYFASFAALNAPDAEWAAILSLVPFFSPYLMPVRMLLSTPPLFEVVGALVLLVLTLLAAIWIAARIYSAGVLLYGQRASFRQVLRAARVAR